MKAKFFLMGVVLVLFAVATRLVPHPANFTAIGALALWSTTLFRSRMAALTLPIVALILSDLVLGFHPTMVWVYGAFLLIAAVSMWLNPRESWSMAFGGSLAASLSFFMITNMGVWAVGELYPSTVQGLMDSYAMGLPFLKNQILGDLFYTGVIGVLAKILADKREASLASQAA